jgi:hypothetical protein
MKGKNSQQLGFVPPDSLRNAEMQRAGHSSQRYGSGWADADKYNVMPAVEFIPASAGRAVACCCGGITKTHPIADTVDNHRPSVDGSK